MPKPKPKARRAAAAGAANRRRAKARTTTPGRVGPQGDGACRVVIVTGMSGAGRSSALKVLEDMGYEAVDNLPLSLLTNLVARDAALRRPLAVGVDIRNRDFDVATFREAIDTLRKARSVDVRSVFLDCDDEVLRRRYAETRHRHPLATDRPVADGIRHERRLLMPIRSYVDAVVDTTHLGPSSLRQVLQGDLGLDAETGVSIFVTSFSYRYGLPREADLVFDVRFLANPHYEPALQPLTGQSKKVARFIADDPGFTPFLSGVTSLLAPLLPRFEREGKSYLTIAIGCTGGRHRSVFVAETLASWLKERGQRVTVQHRDIDRHAAP
ncbi:MAG: RNase adapter RapZ [Alphaproteobacteria bacterium]